MKKKYSIIVCSAIVRVSFLLVFLKSFFYIIESGMKDSLKGLIKLHFCCKLILYHVCYGFYTTIKGINVIF